MFTHGSVLLAGGSGSQRQWTLGRALAVAALAAVVSLGGCAADDGDGVVVYEPPADSGSQSPEQPVAPVDDVSRNDLVDELPVTWERYEVIGDSSVRVFFWTGTEECYGSRAVVEESAEQVRIGVFSGVLPEAADACIDIAREASLLVETVEPVGDREVVPLEGAG